MTPSMSLYACGASERSNLPFAFLLKPLYLPQRSQTMPSIALSHSSTVRFAEAATRDMRRPAPCEQLVKESGLPSPRTM